MIKKLYKSSTDVKICGVCAGIANYINVDVTIVRLLFLIFGITGTGFLVYIACAIIMPRESDIIDYTQKRQ